MTALTLHQDELANMFKLAPVSLWVEDLAEILFRYEAPALADAANGALRRDAEH